MLRLKVSVKSKPPVSAGPATERPASRVGHGTPGQQTFKAVTWDGRQDIRKEAGVMGSGPSLVSLFPLGETT